MKVEVFDDTDSVAQAGAAAIAAHARAAVTSNGRFAMAVSGGHTPWIMFGMLARGDVPWFGVPIFQVDERVTPDLSLIHI